MFSAPPPIVTGCLLGGNSSVAAAVASGGVANRANRTRRRTSPKPAGSFSFIDERLGAIPFPSKNKTSADALKGLVPSQAIIEIWRMGRFSRRRSDRSVTDSAPSLTAIPFRSCQSRK